MEGRHDHWTTFDEDHPSAIPTKYGLIYSSLIVTDLSIKCENFITIQMKKSHMAVCHVL